MKILIQKQTKGYVLSLCDDLIFADATLQEMTRIAGLLSDLSFEPGKQRPTITILPIKSNPMAMTKKTYPAKPLKAVAKKKVVKKGKKK